MSDNEMDDAASKSGVAPSQQPEQHEVVFDKEFVEKVARCKMQYPDMFVSDFFNDESGIQPMPDIEREWRLKYTRLTWPT